MSMGAGLRRSLSSLGVEVKRMETAGRPWARGRGRCLRDHGGVHVCISVLHPHPTPRGWGLAQGMEGREGRKGKSTDRQTRRAMRDRGV